MRAIHNNPGMLASGPVHLAAFVVGAVIFTGLVSFQARSTIAQTPPPQLPNIAGASDEGQQALATFKYPAELTVMLFASEPDVANPVAIDVDRFGRVLVCETFRQEVGVEDNREHPEWLDEDLAAQTVEDRIHYILKHEANAKVEYTERDDRIRLLEDTNNDGRADKSTVFSDRYNAIEDGTGAGVLAVGDDVFYTNIPHLWKLTDTSGDGVADQRISLHRGFGVRFAFRGHDLHGLILGPDGRLYFSVGDRGYNISPDIKDPTSGAVFSCERDGSDLRVFATGLRNPQELAFDNYGNLFTGDNNSDSGDKARWVYVVPGGDSGWRMYYQYLPDRGPFNREKIWQPNNEATPAYVVPPIDNIADGPSGLAFYPGTGFSDFFRDRFFLCDFRGAAAASGIWSFRVKPKGAGFEITDMDQTIWNTLATDIDFGPDGKLYLADWVFGWVGENKGRIYTYFDPARIDSDAVNQVREILRVGLDHESDDRLVELLGHDDRRVRMAAQLELVKQKKILRLYAACTDSDPEINLIRRLHALWGLKQLVMAGADSDLSDPSGKYRSRTGVVEILSNPAQISNAELRAQAVKYGGDVGDPHSAPFAARGLSDESPRVRFMAGLALEKIGTLSELPDVLAMLAENSDTDRYLRHAGIMAVFGILRRLDNDQLLAVVEDLESHESRSVRLAGVVALRRLHSPIVKDFLADSDARVVLEAARAIHDLPIPPALDALAQLIVQPLSDDALVRRVINANMILGHPDNALALARFAADSANAVDRRSDALQLLGRWMSPGPRDYVLGDWRPVTGQRRQDDMAFALETQFQNIVEDGLVAAMAIEVCNSNKLVLPAEAIQPYIIDSRQSDELRIAALKMLRKSNAQQHREVLETLAGSLGELPDELAGEVTDELISIDLPKALGLLQNLVNADDVNARRKQLAVKILGSMNDQASAKLLLESLKLLERGHLNPALWLDVMMAAENRHEDEISRKLNDIRQADAKSSDKLAPYLSTLYGGDAKAGAKIFFEKTEVSCLRCHLVDTRGGTVGPDLSSIGATKDRRYLLESIVEPNKTIAEGFGQLVVLTDEGLTFTGIKKSENDNELLLMDADGKLIRIDKDAIEGTREGLSSMPVDFAKQLTRVEIRDLIEFLVHCDARRSAIHH